MAAFHAAKEAKWLRDLLIELNLTDLSSDKPVKLLGDNDQATRWTIHGMVTTGNKTVRMNYHWVQECVRDGIVDPRRVDTVLNTSDIFTKSLGSVDIDRLRPCRYIQQLSPIHISEPTRQAEISYAVFCLKQKTTSPSLPFPPSMFLLFHCRLFLPPTLCACRLCARSCPNTPTHQSRALSLITVGIYNNIDLLALYVTRL